VVIDKPVGALAMLLLSWLSGVGVGIILMSAKPWFPEGVIIVSSIYARINMIASGKMFVANSLPAHILALFDWNPLFHTIDQSRGFIFINYNPHFSSISYPIFVSIGLIVLGMGKLGAGELNYSSDVDIIVLYDTERVRGIDPDEMFK
jgi:ABC-type polysaccharide/polyol phosphate export permease